MAEDRIDAETRTEFGKGAARRTRRAGRIPAVLYGHGTDPQHLSLPSLEFARVIREQGRNAVVTLNIAGASAARAHQDRGHPPDPPLHRARRPAGRAARREGDGRGAGARDGRCRPRHAGHPGAQHARGRGGRAEHPGADRGLRGGRAAGHADHGRCRAAARGRRPEDGPRCTGGQRRRGADRGADGLGDRHRGRGRRRGAAADGRRRGLDPMAPATGQRSAWSSGWAIRARSTPRPGTTSGSRVAELLAAAGRRRPVLKAQGTRRRAGGAAGRAAGRARQAAHVHERLRRPGGRAAALLLGVDPADLVVVHDDLDLGVRRGAPQARRRRGRAQRPALDQRVDRHARTTCASGSASAARRAARTRPTSCSSGSRRRSARSSSSRWTWRRTPRRRCLPDGLEPAQNRFHALSG